MSLRTRPRGRRSRAPGGWWIAPAGPRARLGGARVVEPESLAHGESVQRGLQLAVLAPAGAGRHVAALVVGDERAPPARRRRIAAGRFDVYPVDPAADRHAIDLQRRRLVVPAQPPLEQGGLETGAAGRLMAQIALDVEREPAQQGSAPHAALRRAELGERVA